MNFTSAIELLSLCQRDNKAISEIMLKREVITFELEKEVVVEKLYHAFQIMKDAIEESLEGNAKSMGGLIGGEAKKINEFANSKQSFCGNVTSKAIAYAMGVLEINASMGLIVAAPTAGASGVIPGSLIALQEEFNFEDEKMINALLNASAIGYLITRNATVSGAEGGCQVEVGSASAMAASAICELMGGTPKQCMDAASTAIMNLLGLACDPIAGLVEVPCQMRNAIGASNALISAQIILSGVVNMIPLDEMIESMYQVGRSLPSTLRETAMGGSASTPTGCAACISIFKDKE